MPYPIELPRAETVTHIAGAGPYSIVHVQNGKPLLLSKTLWKLESDYPDFVRVHKRNLINPHYVEKYIRWNDGEPRGMVLMKNGIGLPVARRRIKALIPKQTNGEIQ